MGHFRVPKTLTFKMRLGAQPLLWKWVLIAWEWKMISMSKAELLPSSWNRSPGELETGVLMRERSPRLIPGELRKFFKSPMVNKSVTLFDSRSSGSSVARYWHHCWSHCAFPDYLYRRKKGEEQEKRYELSDFHCCLLRCDSFSPLQHIGPCAIWMSTPEFPFFCLISVKMFKN